MKSKYITELENEAKKTRRILERLPMDKLSWAPHEKSMTLEKIARHITNLPRWITNTMQNDGIDFSKSSLPAVPPFTSGEELASHFDANIAEAKAALEAANEEDFAKTYTISNGEHVISARPKEDVLRDFAFNHIVHHRGQLSVYLRLLDVPVPGMYGPSADDRNN